jgi:carboxyl-terminal processing protease
MKYILFILLLVGETASSAPDVISDTITEVLTTIRQEAYYSFDPFDVKKATVKALDTFSRQIDDHTRFLGPEAYKELLSSTSGDYYGIGIELGPKKDDEDFLMILQVKPGSPAEKVGIKRYDKILGIDGAPIGPEAIEDNIIKLRGTKRFEPVTLTIARDTKILTLKPKRDLMQSNDSWSAYLPDQRIIYCHISLFTRQVTHQVERFLQKGLRYKPQGIIIDLRDNSGGLLQAAVDCAGLFLPTGTAVVSIKNNKGQAQ